MNKDTLLGLTTDEIHELLNTAGFPGYRGLQIADWLYRKQVENFKSMANLPEKLRSYLEQNYQIGRAIIENRQVSSDGTIKLLLRLADNELIETVGLPYIKRFACCVSSQAGCPVGCIFCATGCSGFRRNLTSGEIVAQVLEINKALRQQSNTGSNPSTTIDHIVFMGMGEPLLNYTNTIKAINLMNQEMGIGARHITLSTVGYVPGIRRLAKENLQITLAISLHAATDEIRNYLMPSMHKWTLNKIIEACKDYFAATGRKITFEYCLISGINDKEEQALKLANLIKGMNCSVNIITHNKVPGVNLKAPDNTRCKKFTEILRYVGITVTTRIARGIDIDAGCGQLRVRKLSQTYHG